MTTLGECEDDKEGECEGDEKFRGNMEKRLARIIANAAVRSARELGDVFPLLKEAGSDELAERLKDTISSCIYETYESVLQPIFDQFSDLKEEFDENLQRYGRNC